MNRIRMYLVAAICTCLWTTDAADGCAGFLLARDDTLLVGRNYDWHLGAALWTVNQPGIAKKALTFDNPASWTSRYGSITMNQYGREFPCDGMNEQGLVVAVMWLDDTRYPPRDQRPSIGTLQWVQYQLDTAATVQEVIDSDARIRITPLAGTRLHYFVADREGKCATIEFLEGRMVVHTDTALIAPVLTNSVYAESASVLKRHQGFGGAHPVKTYRQGGPRFVCAAAMLLDYQPSPTRPPVDYAFHVLSTIAQGDFTKWSLVYDLRQREIHLHTLTAPQRRFVRMDQMTFGEGRPVRILDANRDMAGDVTGMFSEYSADENLALLRRAFAGTPLLNAVPQTFLELLARYPETCGTNPVPGNSPQP